MLYYKLLKYGISGHVYNVIKSMCSAIRYRYKFGDSTSSSLLAISGVKQGCPLTPPPPPPPPLSNIYQDGQPAQRSTCTKSLIAVVSQWKLEMFQATLYLGQMICCYFQHRKRIVTELREGETYCYKWGLVIDAEKQKQTTLWYYENRPIHQRVLNMGVYHCKIANCLHILIRVEIQTPGSYTLSTSRISKKQYETYPLCQREPETVTHFILRSCGTVIDFIPWWRP